MSSKYDEVAGKGFAGLNSLTTELDDTKDAGGVQSGAIQPSEQKNTLGPSKTSDTPSGTEPTTRNDELSFKDPTQITRWLRYLLFASIAINILALVSNFLQHQLLVNFSEGVFSSPSLATEAANTNDSRQQTISRVAIFIAITTVVLFSMWIYRANLNARRLGASNMEFTPGWAVGYYFIPILSLWKPYQAMREIWQASKSPATWPAEKPGAILPWWWFSFLGYNLMDRMASKIMDSAKELPQIIHATGFLMASNVVSICAISIALILVNQIYHMQMSRWRATA